MTDGRRGLREAWPAALIAGAVFAVCQFAVANYISTQLTDIIAALAAAGAPFALLQVWSPTAGARTQFAGPGRPAIAGGATSDATFERKVTGERGESPTGREILMAFAPYLIIIVVLGITSLSVISTQLEKATSIFTWPGFHVINAEGKAPSSETFKLTWLTAAGTWLFVSGVLTAIVLRVHPGTALRIYGRTLVQLRWAIVTVWTVLAVAYVTAGCSAGASFSC